MKLSDLISLLSRIDDEDIKTKPKEETKEEIKEEIKIETKEKDNSLNDKDLLINSLKEQLSLKEALINENMKQIQLLKEQATIDNPIVEPEYTLQEIIEKGEF